MADYNAVREIFMKINDRIPLMTELQRERMMGFGEGMLLMTDRNPVRTTDVPMFRAQRPAAERTGVS